MTCTRPSDKHKQTSGKEKPKSRQVRGPRVSSGSLEEPDVSPASAEQRDSSSVNRLQPQADLRGESPIPNGHLHTQTHEGQAASSRREPLQRGRQGGLGARLRPDGRLLRVCSCSELEGTSGPQLARPPRERRGGESPYAGVTPEHPWSSLTARARPEGQVCNEPRGWSLPVSKATVQQPRRRSPHTPAHLEEQKPAAGQSG